MALIRTFTYKGHVNEYLVFRRFDELDHEQRRCTAIFALYKDKATREASPADGIERAVRLRLEGDKFDEWVGKAVIAGPPALDVTAQIYLAAKSEPVDYWAGRLPNLADATDDL